MSEIANEIANLEFIVGKMVDHQSDYSMNRTAAVHLLDVLRRAERAEALLAKAREALSFAASCIKSGEPWTEHCEAIIGSALRAAEEERG